MTSGGVYACRFGAIDLRVDDKEIILINTLVLHEKSLEFDLLAGIDTIKTLGEMSISPSDEVWFLRKESTVCSPLQ